MPSQGQFSNTPPASGSINVLYKTINNQEHVKAITIRNSDLDGDDIGLSLNELQRISLPITGSGNVSLAVNSVNEKNDFYFIDVEDTVINSITGGLNKNIAISPFLAEPFFYNNYNAIISNADTPEKSFLRYDIDRSSGQVRPNNFNAIAGFGEIVFTTNYIGVDGVEPTYKESLFSTSSNNIIAPLTSSTQEFFNNRDLELRVLTPDLESAIGVPQTDVIDIDPLGLGNYTNASLGLGAETTLRIEVDDNKDFDNSNSHRSKFNLVTQTHTQGELNFTYSPFKRNITSGSFTSGNVFVRVIQETRITARIHDPSIRDQAIAITPLLNSQEGSQVDYLTVTQFFSDQFPYAAKAEVQDSFYTDTGLINARYNGTKTNSADYGGLDPAISATSFAAKRYRPDEDTDFICSQSLSNRGELEDFLFFGSDSLPTNNTSAVGAVTSNTFYTSSIGSGANVLTNDVDTSTIITGQPQDLLALAVGDFIQFSSGSTPDIEIMQVANILNVTIGGLSLQAMNAKEIQVVRGALGTTPISTGFAEGTITRFSGTRVFQLDKSRILAASNSLLWVKDNRTVIRTDETGYVVSTLTCTSGSFN